nr:hypothetical protein [uncultured Haemophilus sp.]
MFEPIFEEPVYTVISIITKNAFGKKVASTLTLPRVEHVDVRYFDFGEVTSENLSGSHLVFVIADEMNKEEWEKIYQAQQSIFLIVAGCGTPVFPIPQDCCFINEKSELLCSKTLSSIMEVVWGRGLMELDLADVRAILGKYETRSVIGYVHSELPEDAIQELLKQFYDKAMLLEDAKGILINLVIHPESGFLDINKVADKLFEVVSEDVHIAIGVTADFTSLEKDKISLCMIAVM